MGILVIYLFLVCFFQPFRLFFASFSTCFRVLRCRPGTVPLCAGVWSGLWLLVQYTGRYLIYPDIMYHFLLDE
ncbi:hypothetical protein V8F06_007455 [Rhypophila decipiens]